jgi:PAS domain S-box-containing protein
MFRWFRGHPQQNRDFVDHRVRNDVPSTEGFIARLLPDRSSLALWSLCATIVAGISALVFTEAAVRYSATLSAAEQSAQSYADILAEHTARTFEAIDRSLFAAASIRRDYRAGRLPTLEAANQALRAIQQTSPAILAVGWTNEAGDVVASSYEGSPVRTNISDLEHFKAQRDETADGLYIAPLFRSRASGNWISSVSRRLENDDGSFAGVVTAPLDLTYFARIYQLVQLGSNDSVTLARNDGTILTREPFVESAVGQSYARSSLFEQHLRHSDFGVFTSRSPVDGISRILAYKVVPDLPLIMLVSADREVVLATWNRRVRMVLPFVGLLIALVVFGTFLLSRRSRQLEEKKALLEATLDNMYQGLIVVDRNDRVAICNRGAMQLLDLPESLMASYPRLADVIALQTDRGEFAGVSDEIKARMQPRRTGEIPHIYERTRPNGIVIEVRTVPFADAGTIRTYKDVTRWKQLERELNERERQFRLLAENATDIIARLNFSGVLLYVSPSCFSVLGYSPEEMIGSTITDYLYPDDIESTVAQFGEIVRGRPRDKLKIEYRIRHKDGHWLWLEANPTLILDEDGAPLEFVDVVREITERKLIEEEAATARQQAENAATAQAQFLATMSHELRTPLNSIVGFADIVLDRLDLAPEARRQIGLIQTASDSLLTVVNDILDFSRIEEGRMELTPVDFDLAKLIEDSVSIVRGAAIAKRLDLHVSIDQRLPSRLIGDDHRLRQVLLNLLNNAIKFTREGQVSLSVGGSEQTALGEEICFTVSDTGIGIPRDKLDSLFKRFSQVDGTTSREFGGSGLGLAISKRLVEAMGGKIAVESVPGQGSIFWFTVTLPTGDKSVSSVPSSRSQPASARPTPARLLLVEDVEVNREIARATLERLGYQIDTVCDGAEAVASVQSGDYDAVLMDIQMPVMDGITATRRIRMLPGPKAGIPIIAMTANVLPAQVEAFRSAGMNGHIGKPFQREELLTIIERFLPGTEPSTASPAQTRPSIDAEAAVTLASLLGPAIHDDLLGQLRGRLEDFTARLSSGVEDKDDLRRQAHSLTSAAGMLGFRTVSDCCAKLEIRLSSGEPVSTLLEEVRESCLAALSEISARFSQADNSPAATRTASSER